VINIWCMSDSYIDVDKEVQFEVEVKESDLDAEEDSVMEE
jgi:hypothetical protein